MRTQHDQGQQIVDSASSTPKRISIITAVELALWALVVLLCVAFLLVKLRNWEPLDRMPQDDFATYYTAATASTVEPGALYHLERWPALTGLNLHLAGPYLYAPTAALLFAPFVGMPYSQAGITWLLVDIGLVATICGLLWWHGRRELSMRLGALLWLLMPATVDNLYLGNINLVMALFITLAYVWFGSPMRVVEMLSGIAIGIAASIKPYPLGLAILGPWARRWWFLAGIVIGLPAAVFLGLVRYGPPIYADYAGILGESYTNLAPPGQSILQNQSLLALGQKLAFAGELGVSVHEQAVGSVRFAPLVATELARPLGLILSAAVAAISLWALWRFVGRNWLGQSHGWTLMLVAMLMLSPVSWSLYVMLVPPLHSGVMVARRMSTPAWRLLFPVGYLFILLQRGYPLWLPHVPVMALTSTVLVGITCWWIAMIRLAQQQPSIAAVTQEMIAPAAQ